MNEDECSLMVANAIEDFGKYNDLPVKVSKESKDVYGAETLRISVGGVEFVVQIIQTIFDETA